MQAASVMIVDESPERRIELKNLLSGTGHAIAAESGYGVQAVSLVEERRPRVVLAAIDEPVSRAIQTVESITSAAPGTTVIAYSSHDSVDVVRQAMRAGARDFLLEPLRRDALQKAIADAMRDSTAAEADDPGTRGAGTIVTVVGAKGGIGKSTIAVNLATAIAARKEDSVLLVDMDTRFGDIAIMMNVEPRYVVADVAASIGTMNRDSFRNALIEHESGVFVLPSVKSPSEWRAMAPDQLRDLLRFAARLFDYVIVDTPGIFGDNVAAAVEVSSQVLLVTTVDITSVKDTTFVLEILERTGFPRENVTVTVNHAHGTNTVTSDDVSRVLHTDVGWELPHDPAVSVGLQAGKPVVLERPRSSAAKSFAAMAARLTGAPLPGSGSSQLFKRMLPIRWKGTQGWEAKEKGENHAG